MGDRKKRHRFNTRESEREGREIRQDTIVELATNSATHSVRHFYLPKYDDTLSWYKMEKHINMKL